MKFINQSSEIIAFSMEMPEMIERAGRTCYKSEHKITKDSADEFVRMLRNRGHHAMIEFGSATVEFITNRGVTHELVRHRLCSFAQESTRYVNYGGKEIEFINPVWDFRDDDDDREIFVESLKASELAYMRLVQKGWRPEQAREVLPNALKTEIMVQANAREWRHIFELRCSKAAHPQMRDLMIPLRNQFSVLAPSVFDDLTF